jgi:hypothetical protein
MKRRTREERPTSFVFRLGIFSTTANFAKQVHISIAECSRSITHHIGTLVGNVVPLLGHYVNRSQAFGKVDDVKFNVLLCELYFSNDFFSLCSAECPIGSIPKTLLEEDSFKSISSNVASRSKISSVITSTPVFQCPEFTLR